SIQIACTPEMTLCEWKWNKQRLLQMAACSSLKNNNLPVTYDEEQAENVEYRVTTIFLYDPNEKSPPDIISLPSTPAIFADSGLLGTIQPVMQRHTSFLVKKFGKHSRGASEIGKLQVLDGRQGNEGFPGTRRPLALQMLIENYRQSGKQESDWNLLHSKVKAYANDNGLNAKDVWASVRTTLNEEGITPKKIKKSPPP
ncbi:MAG TPA: hypothetical protein VKU00_15830, partial [Chthonomonadaceae bacterium]|nr:hypothetical protein [Chthonomonadaceae bacterium]